MKCTILSAFGLLFLATSILAQISPTPVINNEVRDNSSVRMRSIELERVQRDSKRVTFKDSKEQAVKFIEIKADFEKIQKLQAEIIKAYTAEKEINHQKISSLAAEMHKKSIRLEANLFNIKEIPNGKKEKSKKQISLKDLIIELDKAIGDFVESPIFTSSNLVEQTDAEKSQQQLEKVIKLSELLSQEAKKFK